jgi:hypothetical protein
MPAHTTYRLISPEDSPALEALIAATADAGRIGFTDKYQIDLLDVHRALAHDLHGAVALRDGRIVGMPLAFSSRLAEEVRAVGGIADLYTYEGDNHNISRYFTLAMDRTVVFFDRYLK